VGWLVDTSLWVAVERGTVGAADIHAITKQEPVYLSPVNVAELRFGLDLLEPGPRRQRAATALARLRRKPQLRITVKTAETFGELAARIRQARRDPRVHVNDLWLAAQAVERRLGVLTSNGKDFADIPGLRLVVLPIPPRAP
jgi:hypothetical protein